MKAMRRISRKAARSKGERSVDAPDPPATRAANNKEEKRSGLLSPRNLRRVRSHSVARARNRRQDSNTPKATTTQEEVEETQHHEEMLNNMPYETPNQSYRKSTDWKMVTGELHRRMQAQETTPYDEQEQQQQQQQQQQQEQEQGYHYHNHQQEHQQRPHHIEISPMAQKILAKKERQRRGVKSSSESLVSGKSRGSNTRASGPSDRRSSSAHRGQRYGPPRLQERKGGRGPTYSLADEASVGSASHQPKNGEREQATIYASTSRGRHGRPSSQKRPSRHPVDSATTSNSSSSKRRHASQGRSVQAVGTTTPVFKPKRAPPTSPRSVSSRASNKAPSTKARPFMFNGASQKTMRVNVETIRALLAKRMARIDNDEKWEGSTAASRCNQNSGVQGNAVEATATATTTSSSASYCVFSCTSPVQAAEDQLAMDPAEARELQHKMWLEYVKQSIHEAKYGDDATPSSPTTKNHHKSRLVSPPEDVVEPQSSEDSGVVEEYSEDYEDEDARSISSVDLLMKWIGNCGEPPDLSDHFPRPPTQREKLELHAAAKTPRGYSRPGRV